jgi:hypothetical protein
MVLLVGRCLTVGCPLLRGNLKEGRGLRSFGAVFVFPCLVKVSFGCGLSVGTAFADQCFRQSWNVQEAAFVKRCSQCVDGW